MGAGPKGSMCSEAREGQGASGKVSGRSGRVLERVREYQGESASVRKDQERSERVREGERGSGSQEELLPATVLLISSWMSGLSWMNSGKL